MSVHTEHALRQTDKHPLPRSESSEDDVLTLTWINVREKVKLGVRVERVWVWPAWFETKG